MALKTLFNHIRFNRISLPIIPLSSGFASRYQFLPNRSTIFSTRRRYSPIFSLSHSCSGQTVDQVQAPQSTLHDSILQVVLYSPQIPGNAGSIARTCAASAVGLHLVEPLGFSVDDAKLKRAGLDYWPYVVVKVHGSWLEFMEYFQRQEGEKRLLAFTKRGARIHSEVTYKRGDWLLFGSETEGLPPEVLSDCQNEPYGGGLIKIPMVSKYVRCLNLSVSVGVAVYEASRQLNYEQLLSSSEDETNGENTSFTEDIFG